MLLDVNLTINQQRPKIKTSFGKGIEKVLLPAPCRHKSNIKMFITALTLPQTYAYEKKSNKGDKHPHIYIRVSPLQGTTSAYDLMTARKEILVSTFLPIGRR